jgi:hypothetical protein
METPDPKSAKQSNQQKSNKNCMVQFHTHRIGSFPYGHKKLSVY